MQVAEMCSTTRCSGTHRSTVCLRVCFFVDVSEADSESLKHLISVWCNEHSAEIGSCASSTPEATQHLEDLSPTCPLLQPYICLMLNIKVSLSYQLVSSLCIPQEIVGAHDLLSAVSNTKQCCTLNFLGSPTGFRGVTDLDMRSANGYSELIRGT